MAHAGDNRGAPFWIGVIGAIALITGAGLFTLDSLPTLRRARRLDRFEPVQATVISTSLTSERRTSGGKVRHSHEVWKPRVSYHFHRDGIAIASDRIALGRSEVETRQAAGRILMPFTPGQPATVYVDPADRSFSVADRRWTSADLADNLVIPALLALVGVGGITGAIILHRRTLAA